MLGRDDQIPIRFEKLCCKPRRHVRANSLRCGIHDLARMRRGIGFIDRAEQDAVIVQHYRTRRRRAGGRSRDRIVGTYVGEIVAHRIAHGGSIRIANPRRADTRRKIVDEVAKRAYLL